MAPGPAWYGGLAAFAVACVLAIAALGILGVYQGLQQRTQWDRQGAAAYLERGLLHQEEGNLLLALAEFEEAVRLDPGLDEARTHLIEVRGLLGEQASPTSAALAEASRVLLDNAWSLYEEEDWDGVIIKLEQLKRLDPGALGPPENDLLFEAYRRAGTRSVQTGQIHEAESLFGRALALRPDDLEISNQHHWAALYVQAMEVWELDWEESVALLEELHVLSPDYADSRARLHQAYVSWADQHSRAGDWCQAEDAYFRALEVMAGPGVEQRMEEASARCLEAAGG